MATIANAIQHMRHNSTPYWWLFSGQTPVGKYTASNNLEDSIAHFETSVSFLPDGNYRLKSSDKEANHSGAVNINFVKSGTTPGTISTAMQTAPSTNAYGIPDAVLMQIQNEARKTLLFEQMHDKFGPLVDLVKDLERRLKAVEKELADEDGDGTPDFLQNTLQEGAKSAIQHGVKKVIEGGSLFGRTV